MTRDDVIDKPLILDIARAIDDEEDDGGPPSLDAQLAAVRVIRALGIDGRSEAEHLQELGELILLGTRPSMKSEPERLRHFGAAWKDAATSIYNAGWRPGWGWGR